MLNTVKHNIDYVEFILYLQPIFNLLIFQVMSYLQFSINKELGTISFSADGFLGSLSDSSSIELFQAWLKSAKETVIEIYGDGEISVTDFRISVRTGNMYVNTYVRDALGLKSDVGLLFFLLWWFLIILFVSLWIVIW